MPAAAVGALPAALPDPRGDAGSVVQVALRCPSGRFALSLPEGDGGIPVAAVPALIRLVCEKQIKDFKSCTDNYQS